LAFAKKVENLGAGGCVKLVHNDQYA
jgi:hypothetical protein